MKRFFSIFQQQQNPPPGGHGIPGGQSGLPGASPLSPPSQHRSIDHVHPTFKQKLRSNEKKFHMRVVIRGDRGCGKTQLFKRLRGEGFDEVYNPSNTLKSGYVHWNYKSIDDVIVLELWDVPDSSKKKTNTKLKLQHGQESSDEEDTDSSTGSDSDEDQIDFETAFEQEMKQMLSTGGKIEEGSHMFSPNIHTSMIDIYKNTHCVLIMINPLKRASWKFAKRQVRKVPKGIDIAFLINFKDLEKEHKVSKEEVSEWSSNFESETRRNIHILESSMKDCYGLKTLFTYFNIPFSRLKLESVKREMKRLEEELKGNIEEVDLTIQSASYTQHKNWLAGGNSPEGSIPFLRELGQPKSVPGKGATSPPPVVKTKEEPPSKKSEPEKTIKDKKTDLADIPEHIRRKYDLLLNQPTISVKSSTKITSVDDFRIEGSNDGFWGDDSDSDSDKSDTAPVVSTAGLLSDEVPSDEEIKKKPSKSKEKKSSHRGEKKRSKRSKLPSDTDSDESDKESRRKRRKDRSKRKEKSKTQEKPKKEAKRVVTKVEDSDSDDSSSEEDIRSKQNTNARGTEKSKLENKNVEKEQLEEERLRKEKLEKERLDKEKFDLEKLEKERLEKLKEEETKKQLEKERAEKEEKERIEAERLERERLEKEERLATSFQDIAIKADVGNDDFFGEDSESEDDSPLSNNDVDNDFNENTALADSEVQNKEVPKSEENPLDKSEIPEDSADAAIKLADQDFSNVIEEEAPQDLTRNVESKLEDSEVDNQTVNEVTISNQDVVVFPKDDLQLSDSEEEVGYITRKSVSDKSDASDESDESDDSESDDARKKRSGKRGAQKGAVAKRKAPKKSSKVAPSSKPSISEDVLKAIQEAEAQLKANVLEEQKKKEEMMEMKKERKEKKESKSKKSGERRSRTTKKDSEKKKGSSRSTRRKKSEETESDDDDGED